MDSFDPWLSNQDLMKVFDWETVFGNENEVQVDLGAGDGSFALGLAEKRREINLIAVERLLGRVRKIAKKAVKNNYSHLRAMRLESWYFIKYMCPPESLSIIHIMFPDPWPKRKHFRRRLIQPEFIDAAFRALKPGGVVRFSTDHDEYFQWMLKTWAPMQGWEKLGEWDFSEDPKSDFQLHFEGKGKLPNRCAWEKVLK